MHLQKLLSGVCLACRSACGHKFKSLVQISIVGHAWYPCFIAGFSNGFLRPQTSRHLAHCLPAWGLMNFYYTETT